MPNRISFPVRPIAHGISTSEPPLYLSGGYSPLITNCRFWQSSLRKRPGTKLFRNVVRPVYGIYLYQTTSGTRATLVLTDTDLIKIEDSGTWSYLTETYTTGTISNITRLTDDIVQGNGTSWDTSGVAAGDKFIIDSEHTSTAEPDADWATIKSVDGATQITLNGHYSNMFAVGTYKIRKVYSLPTNERWFTAVVSNKFCFGNGNVPVQYWEGGAYAANLNATYALNARYGIEYANRLFLADVDVTGTRSAITLRWSKENDPTDWTDSTAGELDLQDTDDFIKGLGKVGDNLVVYKERHIIPYTRTGVATSPIQIVGTRAGVGLVAPYSLLAVEGGNVFIGANDFYIMDSDNPLPMDSKIRHLFFDIVGGTEVKNVFGGVNPNRSEWYWVANTTQGQYCFKFDFKVREWAVDVYPHDVTCYGMGKA
jgi:hypothetical protein